MATHDLMLVFMISLSFPQAKTPLKCWAVDLRTFEENVLFSAKVKKLFEVFASAEDAAGQRLMTMEDFVRSCLDGMGDNALKVTFATIILII